MHPHHFSLNLLKRLIDSAPKAFPEEKRQEMAAAYEALLANQQANQSEIEETMIAFGKEIWPYRKAFWQMHERYGHKKEETVVREKLSPELRSKFLAFVSGGGDLEDFRHGAVLEATFTSEEKFALGQAELEAHNQVDAEIEAMCQGEKQAEFQAMVQEYQTLRDKLIEKINILKGMAQQAPKWAAEMEEKARTFEEGFCLLEKSYNLEDIDGAVDYYQGVIEETETGVN